MKSRSRIENQKVWRERVAALEKFPGPIAEYCRSRGLSEGALGYWRKKLASPRREKDASTALKRSGTIMKPAVPAFIPVEVVPRGSGGAVPGGRGLPDPRWVAELILHLGGARS